jgi:hypothetical protein
MSNIFNVVVLHIPGLILNGNKFFYFSSHKLHVTMKFRKSSVPANSTEKLIAYEEGKERNHATFGNTPET